MSNLDRLYYGKKYKTLLKKIDDTNFLNLSKNNTSRMGLFLFASALGEISPIKLDKKEGLILESNIKNENIALINGAYIGEKKDDIELEELIKKENVYNYIQECSNTGFENISDMIDNKKEDTLQLEFIKKLNNMYEKNVEKDNK